MTDPRNPDRDAMRPQPVPCTATGLALSGGGIRSAALCLGAIQALEKNERLWAIDYLSTVSGGGYIGASLSAAMSESGGRAYPFGTDVQDSDAIAHLRNYSNYLLPRGRSGLRNGLEAAVVLLRGFLANAVKTLVPVLGLALLSYALANVLPVVDIVAKFGLPKFLAGFVSLSALGSLAPAKGLAIALAATLLWWAVLRSREIGDVPPSDTKGKMLLTSRYLLLGLLLASFAGIQPLLIAKVQAWHDHGLGLASDWKKTAGAALAGVTALVTALSGSIGRYLEASSRTKRWGALAMRLVLKAGLLIACCVLPVAIWFLFLVISAALIHAWPAPEWLPLISANLPSWRFVPSPLAQTTIAAFLAACAIGGLLGANGYSLHRFYRDRLSKAFLFRNRWDSEDRKPDRTKLSDLQATDGPYPIINAALNVQASMEANKRGRNADFFVFTPDFVGSDLTMFASTARPDQPAFAPTAGMEQADRQLDLATAIAISGAAVSANMGSSTVRVLSPTLALLNVRLGYWLRNPRAISGRFLHWWNPAEWLRRFKGKIFLLTEIMNLHDETSPVIFLSDGGHIENLGVYELLKRGCETIVVIDAEADPDMAFPSLLKLERYARIDLGVRISLPWEKIAARTKAYDADPGSASTPGPHCAVGRILYADGEVGTLVYFKSSVSGDEKDYILDYKRRNSSFPHETTSDQFFGEEQFEMYRALGFHMVDGFFGGDDQFSFCEMKGWHPFADADAVLAEVDRTLPPRTPRQRAPRNPRPPAS